MECGLVCADGVAALFNNEGGKRSDNARTQGPGQKFDSAAAVFPKVIEDSRKICRIARTCGGRGDDAKRAAHRCQKKRIAAVEMFVKGRPRDARLLKNVSDARP